MSPLPGWLADPSLARVWGVLRERLEARGLRPEGRVVLAGLSRAERHAVAGLLGRVVTGARVSVDLGRLDGRLVERSGAGGLVDVVAAATGAPLRDRPAQRAERSAAREEPFTVARDRLAGAAWLEEWLDGVRRAGVLARARDPVAAILDAAAVLDRLRDADGAARTSRTELAAAVVGEAHALDDGRTVTALVLRALAARAGVPVPATAGGRRDLWERFGVSVDAVSTTCLTLGLRAADSPVAARLALAAEAGDPVHLTPWDLRRCRLDVPDRVLVCENPRVLEAVAERFGGRVPAVCVSGQPALVVLDVLRGLAGARLRYHGDFDWPGIAIANRLVREVGALPWRMGAEEYLAALRPANAPLAGAPVEPVWNAELGAAMRHHGVAVHEEAVVDDLLAALT